MYTFPTFSSGKWVISGLVNTRVFNSVSEAPFAAGYSQRSQWTTWDPKQFIRDIRVLSAADVTSFETFLDNINRGADQFAWYDSHSTNYYHVWIDLKSLPIQFALEGRTDLYRLKKPLILNEYSDSETSSGECGWGVCGVGVCGV